MKTSFATVAALLSGSYAATVTLETTQCLNSNSPAEQFQLQLNSAKPVAQNLPSVCGLKIVSATDNIDVNAISCRAYKDAAGTQVGSAAFTFAQPALIATNPVQEQAVWCNASSSLASSSGVPSASAGLRSPTANVTAPSNTNKPSATQGDNSPQQTPNAANVASVGMGALAVAFAAIMV
ncbi:hypothetical protein ACEQ8H_000859 [Pleosporales sp. CAS-2024a]